MNPQARRWDLTPREAVALQRRLAHQVCCRDDLPPVARIAGVDVAFESGASITRAAVVVFDAATRLPIEAALARVATRFPYVPGLLSFREIPALLEALALLGQPPDLILCDGHGTSHPRRMGIASHLGLATGLATIGVAKSRLVGEHRMPAPEPGAWEALTHKDETIGAVLRSRAGVRPIYVSSGHRVSLTTARAWVTRCLAGFRLPEPIRAADKLAAGSFRLLSDGTIALAGGPRIAEIHCREDGNDVETQPFAQRLSKRRADPGGGGGTDVWSGRWPGSDADIAANR